MGTPERWLRNSILILIRDFRCWLIHKIKMNIRFVLIRLSDSFHIGFYDRNFSAFVGIFTNFLLGSNEDLRFLENYSNYTYQLYAVLQNLHYIEIGLMAVIDWFWVFYEGTRNWAKSFCTEIFSNTRAQDNVLHEEYIQNMIYSIGESNGHLVPPTNPMDVINYTKFHVQPGYKPTHTCMHTKFLGKFVFHTWLNYTVDAVL